MLDLTSAKARAEAAGCSLQAALHAAWARVLVEYIEDNGATEIVFGHLSRTAQARNDESRTNSSIVPVHVKIVSETQSPLSNARVMHNIASAPPATDIPAEEHSHPSQARERFDTALVLYEEGGELADQAPYDPRDGVAPHDLAFALEICLRPVGRANLISTFDSGQLDDAAARHLSHTFVNILNWIVANPTEPFHDAITHVRKDLLSAPSTSDEPVEPIPPLGPIHSQFEVHASSCPDDTALIFAEDLDRSSSRNTTWTYGELNRKADTIARAILRSPKASQTSIIPIVSERCPELYATILGILKAGKAWCPIDVLSPASRRRDLIARTRSPILVITDSFADQDEDSAPDNIELLNAGCILSNGEGAIDEAAPSQTTRTEDMAYLIWTSGTTGPPKGVPVSHRAATTAMKSLQETIPLARNESLRCIQFSQYTFDVFVQDLFYTWSLGGTLISAPREAIVGSFAQLATSFEATHAHLTPAFGTRLPRASCPTLEVVTMIGEALPQHVADDWIQDMRAFNTYGPAEAAVVSTVQEFSGPGQTLKSTNVGLPLPSMRIYVLKDGVPTLKGGIGELGLAGPQLADGYFEDPDKTASKFVDNTRMGERIYMTGDLVRQLPNGTLEFVGREDDLVKVNGIRIELSEISFALRSCHPLVGHVETGHLTRSGQPAKSLVCFLAAEGMDAGESGSELVSCGSEAIQIANAAKKACQSELPDYMAPSVFVVLRRMPRTPSAKIDRKALQAAYEALHIEEWEPSLEGTTREEIVSDSKELQNALVLQIFSSFCSVSEDNIENSTSLRSLGIDSLAAMILSCQLRNAGFQVNPRDILSGRTVRDVLRVVAERGKGSFGQDAARFDLRAFHEAWFPQVAEHLSENNCFVAPTTPLQESLLAETLIDRKAYWSNHLFELPANTDLNCLQHAWHATAVRTEALRTSFLALAELQESQPNSNSTFLQLIHDRATVNWAVHSAETITEHDQIAREAALRVASHHFETRFREPPWAVSAIQQPESVTIMLTIHHALHDQDSIDLIVGSVRAAYSDQDDSALHNHQLRDVLPVLLESNEESRQKTESFWCEVLEPFGDPDAASWPDLSGVRDPLHSTNSEALISHFRPLTVSRARLSEAAQKLSISPTSIIRAAWGLLVLGYFDAEKCVLGEVRSERLGNPDLSDAVAPMVAVQPVPFHARDSLQQFLTEQFEWTANALVHRSPPPSLVRKLIERPRHLPLYASVFVYHNQKREEENLDSSVGSWSRLDDPVGLLTEHPTAFNIYDEADHYSLEIFAQESKLSPRQVGLLGLQMDSIVEAMVSYPEQPWSVLKNSLPSAVIGHNQSTLPQPREHGSLTSSTYWVDRYAEHQPGWRAVEVAGDVDENGSPTESWTFRQLHHRAEEIAAYLRSAGSSNAVIAMCAGPTLQSFAAILGIFKSGNTYLPVEENLPPERKELLLRDSRCSALLADESTRPTFGSIPSGCQLIDIESACSNNITSPSTPFSKQSSVDPDSNAYMIYTSGSTGKPKGVLISHRNLCNFVEGLAGLIESWHPLAGALTGTGKFLGLASRAFDVHLCEMFVGWRLGLCMVTAPREVLLSDLKTSLTTLGVTHACFVPSLLDQSGLKPHDVPTLVYFSVGGEKISSKTLETWSSQDKTLVVNAYGPTELAIGCCASRVHSRSNARSIGGPYGNTEVHVLIPGSFDYALRGQAGELCFTGDLVGNGYFQRPDAQGFVEDFHGKRMYRSGDVGRMMADGTLEFLGRDDDQTKIRGQRIELGEVTGTIQAIQENLADAATMLLKHPALPRSQLISFVSPPKSPTSRYGAEPVFERERETWAHDIHQECKKQLPAFMVPDLMVPVSVIPLAPISGKADTKLLKSFFERLPLETLVDSRVRARESSAPTRALTPAENIVKDAICTSISTDGLAITPDTNIFELGFDSLSVISLCMRMRRLGFECDVPTVLSRPVVHELGSLPRKDSTATEDAPSEADDSQPDLSELERGLRRSLGAERMIPSHIDSVRPCLPLQEAMVAKSSNSAGEELYVNRVTLRFEDGLDIDRLRTAFSELVAENPILRTSFAPLATQIVQLVHSTEAPTVGGLDLSYVSEQDGLEKLEQRHAQIARDILHDIWEVPPFRAYVLKSPSHPPSLSLFIHHALYDGASLRMLLNDLFARYIGAPATPRTSFDELIRFHVQQDRARQQSFWTSYLSGHRATAVVADSEEGSSSQETETELTISLTDLRHLSSSLKTTPSILLQFIFAVSVSQLLEQDDVIFGIVLSGRSVPVEGVENVAAPCITTIPSRLRLPSTKSLLVEVLKLYQKSVARCLENQFTSLRDIQRWLLVEKPIIDCLFSYTLPAEEPRFKGRWTEVESSMPPDYPFAMEIEAFEASDTLISRTVFRDTPEAHQITRMLVESFCSLIQGLHHGEELHVAARNNTEDCEQPDDSVFTQREEGPWKAEENIIRQTIRELLVIEEELVTKDVSFFRLGIDSVSAIPLAHRLRQAGLPVLSADVIRHPSIKALWDHTSSKKASELSEKRDENEAHSESQDSGSEKRALQKKDYPCTALQTGMILATLSSSGEMYMHHHVLRLHSGTNISSLRQAWDALTAFHDVLRTSFYFAPEINSHWRAKAHATVPSTWTVATSGRSLQQVLDGLRAEMKFTTPGDFKICPVRATLLQEGDAGYLIVSMHHALYDGNSIGMLLDNLARFYHGSKPVESLPFFEVAKKLSDLEPGTADFWARNLEGYSVGSETLLQVGQSHVVSIDRPLSTPLSKVLRGARMLDATPQAVIMLAFAKVLCSMYGRRDMVFGSVMSGRALAIEGIEDVVGPVFNTVPFRVTLGDRLQTNRGLVQQIQQFISGLDGRAVASLRTVQDLWRKNTQGPKARLFSALLLYQKGSSKPFQQEKPWQIEEQSENLAPEYPFNLEVEQTSENLVVKATSCQKSLSKTGLDEAMKQFEDCLLDIVHQPQRNVLACPPALANLPLKADNSRQLQDGARDKGTDSAELGLLRNVIANMCHVDIEQIHAETNIFQLGLDSISAIKLVSKCRKKGISITVANILQGETLRGILKLGQVSQTAEVEIQTEPTSASNGYNLPSWISEDKVEELLPCLSGQTYHLALAAGIGRDSPSPTFAYEAREKLDVPRFGAAWNQLCRRHSILRTVFAAVSPSEAIQIILKPSIERPSLHSAPYSSGSLEACLEAHADIRFDLFTPPWKIGVVQGSDSDVILLTLHHALYDAWSLPAMLLDLIAIYNGQELEDSPNFPKCVRDCSNDLGRRDEASFWKRSLKDKEISVVPRQNSSPNDGGSSAFLVSPSGLSIKPSRLQESCQKHGIPLPVVVTLAFARLVARLTGTSHPTFGYYHASRSAPGASAVVGPLLNMTPLVVPAALDGSVSEKVAALRRELASRLPYEQSSLASILEWVGISDKPLFNTHINILWRTADEGNNDQFLKPKKIDLPPRAAGGGVQTTVDKLRWPISEDGIWVDVVLNTDDDSVQMAAKCVGGLLDRGTMEARLREMSDEIEAIAEGL